MRRVTSPRYRNFLHMREKICHTGNAVRPFSRPKQPVAMVSILRETNDHSDLSEACTIPRECGQRRMAAGLAQRGKHMRSRTLITAILLASIAQAREPKHYQSGTL